MIDQSRYGVYPYEICLRVHPTERGWFPYLISDLCCIHSLMFAVQEFYTAAHSHEMNPRTRSISAERHLQCTLRLLQKKIDEVCEQGLAVPDSLLIVVMNLADAAQLKGETNAAAIHIAGLAKMVALRGGLRKLTTHNNLPVKVCR